MTWLHDLKNEDGERKGTVPVYLACTVHGADVFTKNALCVCVCVCAEMESYKAVGEEIVVPDMHTRKKMMFDRVHNLYLFGGEGSLIQTTNNPRSQIFICSRMRS